MNSNSSTGLPLLHFENLLRFPELHHGITTRQGGYSKGFAEGLNLSYLVDDDTENVRRNREAVAQEFGVGFNQLIFPKQTHSTNFRIINAENLMEPADDTDALITDMKDIAIAVMSADCVPVLLYDPIHHVVAAIHAGWKGTVGGIVKNVLDAMMKKWNTDPKDLIAGIGPSICAKNYEVGKEVIEKVKLGFPDYKELLSDFSGEKAHLDLWKANVAWLQNAGVPEQSIEIMGICTFENHDRFFSARYFKNQTGRFAGVIKINSTN